MLIKLFFLLSGLNFANMAQRQGLYPSPRKPPFVPGFECAGTVEELGEGVTELEVCDNYITPGCVCYNL